MEEKEKKKTKKKSNISVLLFVIFLVVILVIVLATATIKNVNNEGTDEDGEEFIEDEEDQLGEYETLLTDGSKLNTSEAFSSTKTLDSLQITNIQFVATNGDTRFTADVKNTSETATDLTAVTIDVLNEDGETLTSISGLIQELEPGETTTLDMKVSADVANAYDFKIYYTGE